MIYLLSKEVDGTSTYLTLGMNTQRAYDYMRKAFMKRHYPTQYENNKWLGDSCKRKIDNEIAILGFIALLTENNPCIVKRKWFAPLFNVSEQTISTYIDDLEGDTLGHFIYVNRENSVEDNEIKTHLVCKCNNMHYTITKCESFTDTNAHVLFRFPIASFNQEFLELLAPLLATPQTQQSNTTYINQLTMDEKYVIWSYMIRNIAADEIINKVYAVLGKTLDKEEVEEHYKNFNTAEVRDKLYNLKHQIDAVFYSVYEEKYIKTTNEPVEMPAIEEVPVIDAESKKLWDDNAEKERTTRQRTPDEKKNEQRQILYPLFEQGFDVSDVMQIYHIKTGEKIDENLCSEMLSEWRDLFIETHNIDITLYIKPKRVNKKLKNEKLSESMRISYAKRDAIDAYFKQEKFNEACKTN